jgi:hypothetical protein
MLPPALRDLPLDVNRWYPKLYIDWIFKEIKKRREINSWILWRLLY